MSDRCRAFAPATVANVGPGFDVLGFAVDGLGDVVEARRTPRGITLSDITGDDSLPREPHRNTATVAASKVLDRLDAKGGVDLALQKGIAGGSGLGSSAASAAAAAFATNALYGGGLSTVDLVDVATQAETVASGDYFADNTAPSVIGGMVLIRSYDPLDVIPLGVIPSLTLVLVTPSITILTKDARRLLPEQVPLRDCIRNTGSACALVAAVLRADFSLFARSMVDAVVEPVRAQLIPGYAQVRRAAIEAGAGGFTISGSGPTVLAVAEDAETGAKVHAAVIDAFAQRGVASTGLVTGMDHRGARLVDK